MVTYAGSLRVIFEAVNKINQSGNQRLIDIRQQIKDSYENTKEIHKQYIKELEEYYKKVDQNTSQQTKEELIQYIKDGKVFKSHAKHEIVNGLKLKIQIKSRQKKSPQKGNDLLHEFYDSIKIYLEKYSINVGDQEKLNNNENIGTYINSFDNQRILESVKKLGIYSILEEKGRLDSSIFVDLAKITFQSLLKKNQRQTPTNQNIDNKNEIKILIVKIVKDLEESFIDVRTNYNALEKEISGHWLWVTFKQNPIKVSALLLILVPTMVLATPKLIKYPIATTEPGLKTPEPIEPGKASAITEKNSVAKVPTGTFRYGGSTTWAPIRGMVEPTLQNKFPQFKLRYVPPVNESDGTGLGVKMLIDNDLDIAQASRPLTDEEYQRAKSRNITLESIAVGVDGIAIAVNHNLPISGLTISQITDIYTGKITNWNQLGGPNVQITPYSRKANSGTVKFFQEEVLKQKNFSEKVKFISNTTEGLNEINQNYRGIYYASASEIVPQCSVKPLPIGYDTKHLIAPYKGELISREQCEQNKRNKVNTEALTNSTNSISIYPLRRTLFLIIKQSTQEGKQDKNYIAGQAYAEWLLSPEGQNLIAEAGFGPIK